MNKTRMASRVRTALAFTFTLFAANLSHAALTPVSAMGGGNGSERCLTGTTCSGGTYDNALSIVRAIEIDLGLAAGSITRVDDALEQIWMATVDQGGEVLARARYADDVNRLGFDSGSGYDYLISGVQDNTVLVSDESLFAGTPMAGDFDEFGTWWDPGADWTNIPVDADNPFAFILQNRTKTGLFSHDNDFFTSNNSGLGVGSVGYDNSGADDLMVTFLIGEGHYLIAWEDTIDGDWDYNDLVAEVRFVQPVPLPAGLWLFVSALAGMFSLARRR